MYVKNKKLVKELKQELVEIKKELGITKKELKNSKKNTKSEKEKRERAERARAAEREKRRRAEEHVAELQSQIKEIKQIVKFLSNGNTDDVDLEVSKILYNKILSNPTYLYNFAKMTPGMFDLFVTFFKKQVSKDLKARDRLPPEQRKDWHKALQFFIDEPTRGKTCKLAPDHAVLLGLMTLRTGIQQQRLAIMLGVSQSLVCRYTAYIKRVITKFCTSIKSISTAIKKCKTIKARKVWIPGYKGGELAVDGTEISIYEPKDGEIEELVWSVKKHQHSYIVGIIVNKQGLILAKTDSHVGSKHDKTILVETKIDWGRWSKDMKNPDTPKKEQFILRGDSAYTKFEDDYPGTDARATKKKPRGGELTEEEEEFNKKHNSNRIIVENVFAIIKQYGCLQGRFIGNADHLDLTFDAVATLVNFEMLWDKKNDKPTPRMLELMKVANLL